MSKPSSFRLLLPALTLLLLAFLMACDSSKKVIAPPPSATSVPVVRDLDLNKPEDNLAAFVKVRGSTNEQEEVFYYASGTIYSFIPGERDRAILGFEMYNVAKVSKIDGGYQMLTREVGFYKDLETGKIIEKWYNPWLKDSCAVIQVWNDPVNQKFMLKSKFGDWRVPFTENEGRATLFSDIFLHYPENSASDTYEASELFQFFFSKTDLNNPALTSVPTDISWTRVSPFLPWMRMGQRPGNLVYQCRGYNISGPNAWQKIPRSMRDYVMKHHPEFAHAPDTFVSPNETSWTYFKKMMQKKR
jgi:Protein of unknown function (DUF1838)